jgi:hypothetical protein
LAPNLVTAPVGPSLHSKGDYFDWYSRGRNQRCRSPPQIEVGVRMTESVDVSECFNGVKLLALKHDRARRVCGIVGVLAKEESPEPRGL